MKLITLGDLTPLEREGLAAKVKTDPVYLWQCGAGIRTPSLRLAEKLIKADRRLTVRSLLAPQENRRRKDQMAE